MIATILTFPENCCYDISSMTALAKLDKFLQRLRNGLYVISRIANILHDTIVTNINCFLLCFYSGAKTI